jgi:hypothetical protein
MKITDRPLPRVGVGLAGFFIMLRVRSGSRRFHIIGGILCNSKIPCISRAGTPVYLFVKFQPRENVYMKYVSQILERLPTWREERLPPPRVNQSEVMICC